MKEKKIFSKKCKKCRCKNSMSQEDIIFRMIPTEIKGQYVFHCRCCWGKLDTNKKALPKKVAKQLREY